MMVGWALAMPYLGAPDEAAHVIRAAGVAGGQIAPEPVDADGGTGAFQSVPRGLQPSDCWNRDPRVSAACASKPTGDKTTVRLPTVVGRYFPLYYGVVGLPLRLWPNMKGLILARAISGAMSSALLATALVLVVRYSRRRLLVAGIMISTSPMVIHLSAAVNPNGLEVAAAICLVCALIPLILSRDDPEPSAGVVVAAAVGAILLGSLRSGGIAWLGLIAVACFVPPRWRRIRQIMGFWKVRVALALTVCLVGASGIWVIAMDATKVAGKPLLTEDGSPVTLGQVILDQGGKWQGYLEQGIGITAWLDVIAWGPVYIAWTFMAATLVIGAFVLGAGVDRWRLLVSLGGCYLVTTIASSQMVNEVGWIIQGRYLLPMLAAGALFAAFAMEDVQIPQHAARRFGRMTVVLFVVAQLIVFVYTMVRYQAGFKRQMDFADLNPLEGTWHPKAGSLTVLVIEVLGTLLLAWLCWNLLEPGRGLFGTRWTAGAETASVPNQVRRVEALVSTDVHVDAADGQVPSVARQELDATIHS